jgi:hypothetical protein
MRFNLSILLCFSAASTALFAQVGTSYSQNGETVVTSGIPFRAERVTHISRTLSDGNEISQEQHEAIARDAEGRFYDESRLTSSGGHPPSKANLFYLVIDPVAHTSSNWNTLSNNGTMQHLALTTHVTVSALLSSSRDISIRHLTGDDIKTATEDLGKKTIAGLQCSGTRKTTTIPPGRIGNVNAIVLSDERWTSPDLQLIISETEVDPLNGNRTSEFVSVSRDDPPTSLFKVPENIDFKNPLAGGVVNLGTAR